MPLFFSLLRNLSTIRGKYLTLRYSAPRNAENVQYVKFAVQQERIYGRSAIRNARAKGRERLKMESPPRVFPRKKIHVSAVDSDVDLRGSGWLRSCRVAIVGPLAIAKNNDAVLDLGVGFASGIPEIS